LGIFGLLRENSGGVEDVMSDSVKQAGATMGRHEYFERWLETVVCGYYALTLAQRHPLFPVLVVVGVWSAQVWWAMGRLRNIGASAWFSTLVLVPGINILFFIYLIFARGQNQATVVANTWKATATSMVVMFLAALWVELAPDAQFDGLLAPATREAIIIALFILLLSIMLVVRLVGENFASSTLVRSR
jgi:hypothetical protein